MNPRDPESPPEAPAEGAHESLPERVAERVGEEVRDVHDRIEATVEQVLPRRARWSAGKIAWVILASFLGLLFGVIGGTVWYVARHSEWAAGRLTTLVNHALAERSNLTLEARDLRGNPFQQVTVLGARLRFRGDTGAPLFDAPSLTLRYAPWDLWFGKRRSLVMVLDRPVVRLTRGPDGKLRLPEWRAGSRVSTRVRELEVLFDVHDASVLTPDPSHDIVGWTFHGSALSARQNQVVVQSMSWQHGPYASVLERFEGSLSVGDSVQFRIRDLSTPDLHLTASGGWRSGSRARTVHAEISRIRWRWLAKAFDNDVLDVAGLGAARVDAGQGAAEGAPWTGRLEGTATWDSLPLAVRTGFQYRDGRIVLPNLSLRSPAGDLEGAAAYDSQHLDLRGAVAHGNPARWHPIGLDGWPAGDLAGQFHYASQKVRPAGSRVTAQLVHSVLAGWHADSAWVTVNAPSTAPDTFDVRMLRRGGVAVLGGRIDKGGWRGRWSGHNFPLEEWPDGAASGLKGRLVEGAGTVEGRDNALFATGTMRGTDTDWLGIHTAAWRLDQMGGRLLPTPDLALPATHLSNLTFLGLHFDSATAVLRVGNNHADLTRIEARAADTTLTAAGVADWEAGGWRVRLDAADARSRQFHWVGEPPLLLSGTPRGTTFERFAAHDSTAHLAVSGRWALPGGSYDWTGHAEGLDLARLGLPESWGLAGTANATLRVTGPSGDPHWTLEGTADRPGMSGRRLPHARLSLEGARGRVDASQVEVRIGRGAVAGDLHFAGMRSAWPDTLTGESVSRWLATAASWHGQLRADSLALDSLSEVLPEARGWSGVVSGTLAIAGRPQAPEFTLDARARPFGYGSVTADAVDVEARYGGGRLEVPSLHATRGGVTSTVSGGMPLVVAMGRRAEVPDQPMRWRVNLDRADLGLLTLFVPQIGEASGQLGLQGGIEGTPHHPRLTGTAHIANGAVRLAGREERVEQIEADFKFDAEEAVMERLTARQGRHGTVTGTGRVDLSGMQLRSYAFTLALHDFTVSESGLYEINFDADPLTVARGTARVNGHYLPHLSGIVNVRRAVVLFDFANQNETEQLAATTAPLPWTYAIALKANNNVRWLPPNADIEFSADLTLEQNERALSIFGDLRSIRGFYDFLSNRFTVRKADLNFDNIGGVNPLIDAEATTRVTPLASTTVDVSTETTDNVAHNVTVTITGRADHPEIGFESVPADWDQARILRELTVGRYLEAGTVPSALYDPLDSWLTRKINDQLSPLLSATFLRDVGQWNLQREEGGLFQGKGDVFVGISKQVNPQLLVSYRQRVPGFERVPADATLGTNPLERNIEAEYRLNRFFYVTTALGQRRALSTATPTGPDFNVNLHARWEY